MDAQGGGAAAVAIAGLAASVQQKAGLVDGSKRVASNPRKEWSATEDELIRNGVAHLVETATQRAAPATQSAAPKPFARGFFSGGPAVIAAHCSGRHAFS